MWEKNNLTPIPFALAVLNILNIFILSPSVSRIDAVALRQQRSHISTITLTLIPSMTIDRPRRQCSRSSIRQSPWSVSTTFSMAIRSPGAVTSELTLILTIDRPCRQCSRSSICQSSLPAWIQWTTEFRVMLLPKPVWDSRVGLAGVQDSVARVVS